MDSILVRAIAIVVEMCRLLSKQGRETWAEAWGDALMKFMEYCTERVSGSTLVRYENRQKESYADSKLWRS